MGCVFIDTRQRRELREISWVISACPCAKVYRDKDGLFGVHANSRIIFLQRWGLQFTRLMAMPNRLSPVQFWAY